MTMTSAVKANEGAIVVPSYFPGKQWQQVLEAGCSGGWAVCVCGEVDEDLLQTELCEPPAYAEAGELLPFPGAG